MTGIQVDPRDRRPIYEQLISGIRALILRGDLAPDEQMPSVRSLAAELGINPNTIQKAYTELERQGVIYSAPGRGSFVCPDPEVMRRAELDTRLSALRTLLCEACRFGLNRADAEKILDEIWRNEDDPN
ncbi:MAG: GntR family transcriptional regulator [Clostridia bacterium]|nr:GntR family transcriptional regulator [Clostridia bacterium]